MASIVQTDDLLPACYRARCGLATRVPTVERPRTLLMLMALGVLVLTVRGAFGSEPARVSDGAPPSAPVAMGVFQKINPWCRAWRVPDDDLAAQDQPALLGAGVFVQLRIEDKTARAGEVMARGADEALLKRVVRSALSQLESKDLVERDALREEALARLGPLMVVSLEIAGDLTPIEPETEEDFDRLLSPGLDGVAVRLGNRCEAISPGHMLAIGQRPIEGARTAVSRLMGAAATALDSPSVLRERDGVAYFKFRVVHLAQSRVGHEPLFLTRGARVVPQDEVDSIDELKAFADRLAESLLRRTLVTEGRATMRGMYQAGLAAYSSERADDSQSALAVMTLRRYAAVRGQSPLREQALSIADALERTIVGNGGLPPPTAALLLLERPAKDAGRAVSGARLMDRVLLAADPKDLAGVQVQPTARGIIALALAQSPRHQQAAEMLVKELYSTVPVELLVAYMPWLGWADLILAEAPAGVDDAARAERWPHVEALRSMREIMWSRQVTTATASSDTFDVIGGVIFDTANGGPMSAAVRLPTWQVARPLVFAATMLRDARLTAPAERGIQIVRLMAGLRFLKQLQIDESSVWLCPDPDSAMGAIRAAPWSWRCGPDSTSMALLAVCETIAALEALAQQPAAPKPSDPPPVLPGRP